MDYFGIKTPQRDNEAPYIWWIANSRHEAWMSFFQYPSAKFDRRSRFLRAKNGLLWHQDAAA